MLDYPGYGKSGSEITSQQQLLSDVQTTYNEVLKQYKADQIVILGYSIGTGLAAHLASKNTAKRLILQAPYYSLKDLMRHTYPIVPTFLLRYNFTTNEYIEHCDMPITILHGNEDRVIYHESSIKLKSHLKPSDSVIMLENQGHNSMSNNEDYQNALEYILKE